MTEMRLLKHDTLSDDNCWAEDEALLQILEPNADPNPNSNTNSDSNSNSKVPWKTLPDFANYTTRLNRIAIYEAQAPDPFLDLDNSRKIDDLLVKLGRDYSSLHHSLGDFVCETAIFRLDRLNARIRLELTLRSCDEDHSVEWLKQEYTDLLGLIGSEDSTGNRDRSPTRRILDHYWERLREIRRIAEKPYLTRRIFVRCNKVPVPPKMRDLGLNRKGTKGRARGRRKKGCRSYKCLFRLKRS